MPSMGREYIHDSRPSANMFFARSASFLPRSKPDSASTVSEVRPTGCTERFARVPSSRGLSVSPIFVRLRLVNSSVFTMISAPGLSSGRLAMRAAGFIATKTSGASPGVKMSWSAKWIWNALTPGRVPWGARISAGKSGKVDRSLPLAADSQVNRSPVNCIPSPESPANRTITRSRRTVLFSTTFSSLLAASFQYLALPAWQANGRQRHRFMEAALCISPRYPMAHTVSAWMSTT